MSVGGIVNAGALEDFVPGVFLQIGQVFYRFALPAAVRHEAEQATATRRRRALVVLGPTAVLAALLPAIFPLAPRFSTTDTAAAIVAAALTAMVSVGISRPPTC